MGCCGEGSPTSKRVKQAVRQRPASQRVEPEPAAKVMVIVMGVGKTLTDFVGVKSGTRYGKVRDGTVFWLLPEDYEADRRVVKATQETLRMVF